MKFFLVVICFFIPWVTYGSFFNVPNYNYIVYFPPGFQLQEYETDSTLSWFSMNRDVAFTIKSWEGNKFSTTQEMVDVLTKNLDGKKEFAPFDFYGMEASIADIIFTHNGTSHRGWFVVINGEDYDYYLYGYSFSSVYESTMPIILSAIDSVAIGEIGQRNPGLISEFYTSYSSESLVNYEMDLFGHLINIEIGEEEFESTQNLIEREALLMEGYGYVPELFYEAWVRYYRMIYRDNITRFDKIFSHISPYIIKEKYTDYELAELLMFWIQGFDYERRENTSSDMINPLESVITGKGDCDSKSLVLNMLLDKYGIDSILLVSEKVKHAIAGVRIEGEGVKFNYNGYDYLGIELTKQSLIGEIDEKHIDPLLWTYIDLEFDNGF